MRSTLITTSGGWVKDADSLIDAVQAALAETIHAPGSSKTVRLLELPAKALPDPAEATERYNVMEVTLPGRTIEQKQALYPVVPRHLARFGVEPGEATVILYEVIAENWS